MNTKKELDRATLGAFVDGELDLAAQLDLESRIEAEPGLRAEVDHLQALRATIRRHADFHAAPAALRERLASIGAAGDAGDANAAASAPSAASAGSSTDLSDAAVPLVGSGSPRVQRPRSPAAHPGGWRDWFAWRPLGAGFAAACVLMAVGSLSLNRLPGSGNPDDRLMQEVIASHVRSTVGQRLVDVASSDRHTVKPWLSSRLDFSPPVADAPVPGAVFLGGRVDYLDGRPVAALVYRQRQHVIDVYVWPDAHAGSAMHGAAERGFNTLHWLRDGMRYWVVSDLNRDELSAFSKALDQAAAAL